jgi:DNA polymerase-3 subunit epsilon
MRQVFLDTETTGLSAEQGDRVIEIGCVELVNRKFTGNNLHIYLNAGRDSHEEALKVHGLTTEFLADKPRFEEVASAFLEYIAGADVLIHNAPFDLSFLNMELKRTGQPALSGLVASVTDTLLMAKEMFPGKRNSLDALCDRLEVDNSSRALHGALLDAQLLADVYINLTRGQDALLMEETRTPDADGVRTAALDLSSFDLPVLRASEQELTAHQEVLAQIDKSSGQTTVWRRLAGTDVRLTSV